MVSNYKKTYAKIKNSNDSRSDFYNYQYKCSGKINISSVRELKELNPNYKTRRFVFWFFIQGISNPIEYYY